VLIAHCEAAAPERTASDFPLAGIDQHELEALALDQTEIEDIYAATPLQQGLLFHSLLAEGQGVYVNQLRLTLQGDLDRGALRAAWELAIARHPILRTRFELRHGGAALQVVLKAATLPWAEQDWSDRTEDYETRLGAWLPMDLARGFHLAEAPLMRVTLFARPDGGRDLVWTKHHVLTDGWSMAQLVGEVMHAYQARVAGERPALPAPAPYRDYVAWLQRQPSAEAWWREQLVDVDEPALLTESLGRPRPAEPGAHHLRQVLDEGLSERLRAAAQRHQVTLATLMQGAWALLLARYGNRRQVAFGVTVSGRPAALAGIDRMLGLFINSLPLWVDVPGAAKVGAWLQGLQRQNAELRQYEHTPLSDLQRWVGRSGDALFDSLFVFENYPIDEDLRTGKSRLRIAGAEMVERTHYALTLAVIPGHALELKWSRDGERIGGRNVEHLSTRYIEILEHLVETGDRRLGDLALTTAGAAAPAPASYPFRPVVERISEQALRRPEAEAEAEAVSCEGDRISYGALDAWSNRVGRRLKRYGVAADVRVGLCVERSLGLVAGLLGVLKAGGAYVPLDPAYPAERLADMVADSGIDVVVADRASAAALAEALAGVEVVLVEDVADEDPAGWHERVHPDQLAYVIYTSGSTGRPKGVGVTQRNLARLLDATADWYRFGPDDVWTLFHSYAFDFSVWELFGALVHGGRLVVVPHWTARDAEAFHALLRAERVTVLNQTPSAFTPLTQVDLSAEQPLETLRAVIFGGEKLEPAALERWLETRGDQAPAVINMYGITETTVHVTYRPMGLTDTHGEARSLIGAPIPDLSLQVLDGDMNPVPVGGIGELHVGGAGLARGYLGRPGLTAERFVPDPTIPGGRLYKSGDLARRLADDVEYIGRNDFQVKVRGFRIELGEIQAALLGHPEVQEAAVLALDDGPAKRLVAYVVAVPERSDIEALRSHLSERLPGYMVPSAIVFLNSLPLTVNGKLDRRALPSPEAVGDRERVAPRSETEAALLALSAYATDPGHSLVLAQLPFRSERPRRKKFQRSRKYS